MKITISGIGGVGKGTTSKILAEKLNYKVLSVGYFFRKKAKDMNMSLYDFDQLMKDNSDFDIQMDKMQEKFGKDNDNFVLESRIGWYFIQDSIKIKLVCEEDERLIRVRQRDGGELNEINKKEELRLKSVKERYKKLYGIDDFLNKENFDLIIDTTKNPPDDVVKMILDFLEK